MRLSPYYIVEQGGFMQHLLALDAGTGSGRAVVFDENGVQLAVAAREWTHIEHPDYPGSMTFDREKNWSLLCDCIKEVLSQVKDISLAAVTTTSMREGIAVYDERQQELWACANVDARAVDEVKELRRGNPRLEDEIYRITGQTFALGAVPRLLWLRKHMREEYDRAAYVVMLSDWIAHRLGAALSIDPSNGGTTGLFNLETRRWDPAVADSCGIKRELLGAPVFEAGTCIGEVSKKSAEETGIKAGTLIIMGGGDAQLGTVGVGAVNPGDTAVFGGSFWQQEVNLSAPRYDPVGRIRINFHVLPRQWQAEAIVFFPGLVVRWFRDALCSDIKQSALNNGRDPYDVLSEMASRVPAGSHSIIPIFSDAMDYRHWRHAAPSFLNLSLDAETCNRASLFRSLLENAAIVTRANLDRIAAFTGEFPNEVIFAGGASRGPLWCQILSDVLQIPIKTRVVKEATALGAAIFAAKGSGILKDVVSDGLQYVQEDRVYYPASKNKEVYDDIYEKWQKAYALQLKLADDTVTTSLWRAPGE